MKLIKAVGEVIDYKRSLGQRFRTDERNLRLFSRSVGDVTRVEDITKKQVETFLAGKGCLPQSRSRKHHSLLVFERHLVSRGYSISLSLPERPRRSHNTFVPYILSRDELRQMLDAIPIHRGRLLQALTLRTVLLLLYGAGLRISEAVSLNLGDVDLTASLLTIGESKFYKTRLVALGPHLNEVIAAYTKWRAAEGQSGSATAPFFVLRSGARLNQDIVRQAFHRLLDYAKIRRPDGQRPRLHDLRHSSLSIVWWRGTAKMLMYRHSCPNWRSTSGTSASPAHRSI